MLRALEEILAAMDGRLGLVSSDSGVGTVGVLAASDSPMIPGTEFASEIAILIQSCMWQ